METQKEKKSFKQKLIHELSEYAVNVIYLTLFFGAYFVARRLILAHYNIYLDDYFIGIIKALVIGKVIMIGAFLKISKKFEDRPMIVPVLYKVALFVGWCILFDVTEGFIKGWIHTDTLSGAYNQLIRHHFSRIWLAGVVMLTLTFIPFFMLKELSRTIGREKFRDLFLKNRLDTQ
jgi:hypothetical protein